MLNKIPVVLSIAGSDCSGGAGIQADLKTIIANKCYGMSAITALTAQNTMGVSDIYVVDSEFLKSQIESIFTDIFPNAIKIGMISEKNHVEVIVNQIKKTNAKNIVVDPVMVSTSGSDLSNKESVDIAKKKLYPLSTLITPNIPEAQILADKKIQSIQDMEYSVKKISQQNKCSVLLKGGHNINDANDVLYDGYQLHWFKAQRINNPNTHGTGCTLSSAIACNLAKGHELKIAIEKAKFYITSIMKSDLNLGQGSGPLDHGFLIK